MTLTKRFRIAIAVVLSGLALLAGAWVLRACASPPQARAGGSVLAALTDHTILEAEGVSTRTLTLTLASTETLRLSIVPTGTLTLIRDPGGPHTVTVILSGTQGIDAPVPGALEILFEPGSSLTRIVTLEEPLDFAIIPTGSLLADDLIFTVTTPDSGTLVFGVLDWDVVDSQAGPPSITEPTATQPKPTATQPKPTATPPEPTATQPEPTPTAPAPTATPPEPTATPPAPTATQPAPTASPPAPTAALVEPTAATPIAIPTPARTLVERVRDNFALFAGILLGLLVILVVLLVVQLFGSRKQPETKALHPAPEQAPGPAGAFSPLVCPECRFENRANASFCNRCGAPLPGESAVSEAAKGSPTIPMSAAGEPSELLSLLSVGSLIGGERLRVLKVVGQGKTFNTYLVQGQPATLRCPNAECGAVNPGGVQHCEVCGAAMNDEARDTQTYWVKEAPSANAFMVEREIIALGLAHPNLVPPRAVFAEPVGEQTRHYVVLDEPRWQTAEQLSTPQPLSSVLEWGIGLAEGLAYLHEHRIVLHKLGDRQVALANANGEEHPSLAKWADLSTGFVIPLEEWQQTGTRRIASDVRQLAALMYRLATGLTQYDPHVTVALPQLQATFAHALGTEGYTTSEELAATLRQAKVSVRHPSGLDIHAVRLSDTGRQRPLDEDSIVTLELGQVYRSVSMPLGVYAVADGMGGHQGGDVASRLAAHTIARRAIQDVLTPAVTDGAPPVDYVAWLKSVIAETNQIVFERRRSSRNDMGTTLVLAVVEDDTAHIAHVGDSRAYLIADGAITRLTTDHSLVERLVATGQITAEQAATHPQRNVIYRNIGDKPKVEPDITRQTLAPGNVLLLCCDGLSGEISDEEILRIVTQSPSLPEAAQQLVAAANAAGGSDNISVILIGVRAVM